MTHIAGPPFHFGPWRAHDVLSSILDGLFPQLLFVLSMLSALGNLPHIVVTHEVLVLLI